MTFEEAVAIRNKLPKVTYVYNHVSYTIFVTPYLPEDLNKFCEAYLGWDFSDEEGRQYSSDQDFRLVGLSLHGPIVLKDFDCLKHVGL
jgi:hypothetical protein